MDHPVNQPFPTKTNWVPAPLMALCATGLVLGFVAGYLLRGSAGAPAHARAASMVTNAASAPPQAVTAANEQYPTLPMPHQMPSLDDMKRLADKKAAPLLEKLKSDEKNPQLENQIGLVYEKAHQFKEAAGYFQKSLQYDPKNIGVRADYASCLYYTGDVDGALAQLNQSLTYDPQHAGTLMNIGIIKLKGKGDAAGAVAAWEKVLQYHPDFPQKELVQHMIAEAKAKSAAGGSGQKG